MRVLRENFFDNVAAEIGELLVSAVVQIPEMVLLQPERVQQRRVEVAHVIRLWWRSAGPTSSVSPMTCPPFDPAAGEPHREAVRIVIASVAALRHRQPAELAAPDNQR